MSVPAGAPTGRRLLLATLTLSMANFMVVLDTTIANVSIPHIAGSLGVSPSQATWTITSYAVADAITVTLAGWLAQRFGGVRTFIAGLIGFATFSVLCSTSVTIEMLVIARIGQGLCGGPLIALSQTLLMRIYPIEKRAQGQAFWSMTTLLGPVLGPVFGGLISDGLSWHWIFLINLPVAMLCIFSVLTLLRPIENARVKLPIDWFGFLLLVTWIGALQIVLDTGREHDWFSDPTVLTMAIIAGIGFAVFLVWELTAEHPIVNLRVFRHRGYTMGVLCFTLGFSSYYAGIIVIPQWLQTSLGYSATQAGYATCVSGIAALTMTQFPPRLMRLVDPRLIVTCGLFWIGGATLLRSEWTSQADFWTLLIPQLLMGFAIPFFFNTVVTMMFASVQPQEQPAAAGMFAFMRTMGLAFAASLSLTYWDNQARVAGAELVGKVHGATTVDTLVASGFSFEQSRMIIGRLVEQEAITLATDKVFLVTGLILILIPAFIWFVPVPKFLQRPR